MSNHDSPINATIITDDPLDKSNEEIDEKMINLQNFNVDELETPKITINGPCLLTENSECAPEVSFRVSIENASTINVPTGFNEKDFLLKECEIKLEPMAFAEFHDEYPDEDIMNPGNYWLTVYCITFNDRFNISFPIPFSFSN